MPKNPTVYIYIHTRLFIQKEDRKRNTFTTTATFTANLTIPDRHIIQFCLEYDRRHGMSLELLALRL